MTDTLDFIPSGLNTHFDPDIKQFDDYLKAYHDLIKHGNPHIKQNADNTLFDIIAPKAYYPTRGKKAERGILLIHGLLDSCAIMTSLYDHYSQKGYVVKNILLPGHGTRPADLLEVSWEDWARCTDFAIQSFKGEVEHLTVMGLSTGACLGCYFAINKASIDKLVLFAPAFKLKQNITTLIQILHKLNTSFPFHIKDWVMKHEEDLTGKYRSITVNGVYQLIKLMEKTVPLLLKLTVTQPLFMILTDDDETICNGKALACFKAQSHPQNRLMIFSNEEPAQHDANITYLPSCIPNERILNFSHVCMTVSPSHPLYGKQHEEDEKYYLGANTPANLINYHFKRLSYNPHFDKMLAAIDDFLETSHS